MQLTAHQDQFLNRWPAFTLPPINLYNAPIIEGIELMQNWIQEITPVIKDTKGDLVGRQNKVIAVLEDADRYWTHGARNMAGEIFALFAAMKYSAAFMATLSAEIKKRYPLDKYERLVNANPVRPAWQSSLAQSEPVSSSPSTSGSMKP